MLARLQLMADEFDSGDGGAIEVQRSVVEATLEAPSDGNLQSSKASNSFCPAETANSFDNFENNGVIVPGQECTHYGVVQVSDAYDAVLANKQEMGVQVNEVRASATKQEEELVTCSEKYSTGIQVIDGTELIEPSVISNVKFNNEGSGTKRNGKQQEPKEKKEKKPRRRGVKARKNKEVLNCYSNERKEKKGLQYSREEMEALRFEKLEEQKKKWIEVYCGLSAGVAEEYDGMAKLDKIHQEDSVPSIDFDPRPQFQKSANLGEECTLHADNHLDDLNASDPSSSLPVNDETGISVVEGEFCEEDDDSDEDYSSIQRPAFMVTGEPDFDSGPPQDGLEYLRRVRWESARIPKVKVAKVNKIKTKEQSPYMPQIPDVMKCPENLLPLKQWEDSFLADFSELRQAFSQLDLQEPNAKETSIKFQSVHNEHILNQMFESNTFEKFLNSTTTDDSCPSEASTDLETNDAKSNPHSPKISNSKVDDPTLSTILNMTSAARTSMLKRRIKSIENMSRLSQNESLWLFALCIAVDCPLDADTSAALRSLLRKCASLRAAKTEVDDEVIVLNIMVTISGRYFGQLER